MSNSSELKPSCRYPIKSSAWSIASSPACSLQHTVHRRRDWVEQSHTDFACPCLCLRPLPDRLLALYCCHFHPNVPIIHLPTFDINSTPAVLLISMLSIGALHHPQPFHAQFGAALLEIVRRMLGSHFAKDHRLIRSIPYVRWILSCLLTKAYTRDCPLSSKPRCFGLLLAGPAVPSEFCGISRSVCSRR